MRQHYWNRRRAVSKADDTINDIKAEARHKYLSERDQQLSTLESSMAKAEQSGQPEYIGTYMGKPTYIVVTEDWDQWQPQKVK